MHLLVRRSERFDGQSTVSVPRLPIVCKERRELDINYEPARSVIQQRNTGNHRGRTETVGKLSSSRKPLVIDPLHLHVPYRRQERKGGGREGGIVL